MRKRAWLVCLALSGCLCGPDFSPDAGIVDSGEDAGLSDAGIDDAGIDDAGIDDAGIDDAGIDDAGIDDAGIDDAGVDDAGVDDAGIDDAGIDDAGLGDAGLGDAGLGDAGINDAGLGDAGLGDAGVDAGFDAGGLASCDPTQIRWTSLPPHAGFSDGPYSIIEVWRTDGGVMLTHHGAYVLLNDGLVEVRSGFFSPDGGSAFFAADSVQRRRDGFYVLTHDFSGPTTLLHHLSEAAVEDRPPVRLNPPQGTGAGRFYFGARQVSGTSAIHYLPSSPNFENYVFRWEEATSTLVPLHSPPEVWIIALEGDAQLIMNYSTSSQEKYTEVLGDGGTRLLSLVGWPPEVLNGQFVLPTFYFFSPGGPVQRKDAFIDAGLFRAASWSGEFDAPLALAATSGFSALNPWVVKWNEETFFSIGTGVESIDRFDEHTLIVSRLNPSGTIDVGLLCDPSAGLGDAGLGDAGVGDGGLSDAGIDDAGIDAGGLDASCDPTQIRWTSLPPHAGFDELWPWMEVWRTDGGVLLTHRGAYVLLNDALVEVASGPFSLDGGYGNSQGVQRRRDGFDVLTNDFPGPSTWLHHLSESGVEDRPALRFDQPAGTSPGSFYFGARQVSGPSTVIYFSESATLANYAFRWDEGSSTFVPLHSPPGYWAIALAGDAQLIMDYSAASQPKYTEVLGDGGTRFLSLVGWPPEVLNGQFVLPTWYFFSPGGPVQRKDALADSGLLVEGSWSGTFDAPLALASPNGPTSYSPLRWVIKWNEETFFSLGTGVHSIDRFDADRLIVSRVNPGGTIDVGLLCDP